MQTYRRCVILELEKGRECMYIIRLKYYKSIMTGVILCAHVIPSREKKNVCRELKKRKEKKQWYERLRT